MVGNRRVPSLIVIGTAINQIERKVSLNTICCLRQFCCGIQRCNMVQHEGNSG